MTEITIDRLVRSRRRTLALMVTPEAEVVVRAPVRTPLYEINRFIFKNRLWIETKKKRALETANTVRHSPEVRESLIKDHKQNALEILTERAVYYSQLMGWKYKSLSITHAEKRWGSCGPNGSLCFSWRLAMAPVEIIVYVVVHELAHLIEKNHSRRFWALVGSVLPDYKLRRKWLRDNGNRLSV